VVGIVSILLAGLHGPGIVADRSGSLYCVSGLSASRVVRTILAKSDLR
jgi:hypothetical protein